MSLIILGRRPYSQNDWLENRGREMLKRVVSLLLSVVLGCLAAALAAQDYPSKPIRVIVPVQAGGGIDTTMRIIQPKLSKALGQPIFLDFQPGAQTMRGIDMVAKAAPDGYTLVAVFDSFPLTQHLFKNVPYDAIKDFAPISMIVRGPLIITVPPQLGVKDLGQLVQLAKSNKGNFNYGAGSPGSSSHLAAELFKSTAGFEAQAVHYKGAAPAMTDTMGGHVQFMIVAAGTVLSHVRSGKLVAIAVTSPMRISGLANVPAVAEFYPGFEAQSWIGMLAPAGTPKEIIHRLNVEIVKVLADPEIKARCDNIGVDTAGTTPEAFAKWIAEQSEKWGRVIRERKITRN